MQFKQSSEEVLKNFNSMLERIKPAELADKGLNGSQIQGWLVANHTDDKTGLTDATTANFYAAVVALKSSLDWKVAPKKATTERTKPNFVGEAEAQDKLHDRLLLEREAKTLLDLRDRCQKAVAERIGSGTSHGRIAAAKEEMQDIYDRNMPDFESAPTTKNIANRLQKVRYTLQKLEAKREEILKRTNPWG